MRLIIILMIMSIGVSNAYAQFPPPAGQAGSTAIFKDSSIIVAWATGCTIERGWQDISDTTLGVASIGDASLALGMAGANGVVSLGDGGTAILTFDQLIMNGPGWDFAVFENSFSDEFLELAFVEVSSDGVNFFRFPATSLTQDTLQVGSFGSVDATKIDNLAGKYRAQYGTPFDLDQLSGQAGLDINAVSHIKLIDVVGSIQDTFATLDQFGNKINDPWSTPFESSGFDLDAVGIVVQTPTNVEKNLLATGVTLYPNPAKTWVNLKLASPLEIQTISLVNPMGQSLAVDQSVLSSRNISLRLGYLPAGIYYLLLNTSKGNITKRLIIQDD